MSCVLRYVYSTSENFHSFSRNFRRACVLWYMIYYLYTFFCTKCCVTSLFFEVDTFWWWAWPFPLQRRFIQNSLCYISRFQVLESTAIHSSLLLITPIRNIAVVKDLVSWYLNFLLQLWPPAITVELKFLRLRINFFKGKPPAELLGSLVSAAIFFFCMWEL